MRGEVPIKYVLKGDREAGKRFMRRGAVLMGMLEHGMTYQGLKQCVMRRWVTPDVMIECDCRFGLRTVTITVAPVTPETIVTPQESVFFGVVVSVSCSSGLFLHHGNWRAELFSKGILQHGHHMLIPDGYFTGGPAWDASFTQQYWFARWANWTEENRLATRQRQFADQWYAHWIRYAGDGIDRPDFRYIWNTPVVMPGFTGKDLLLGYNILYAADDERITSIQDHLRLNELTLQNWYEDGRQPLTTKWIFALRGMGTQHIGNGILYNIEPMPERDRVRRYLATPYNTYHREGLFVHISIRNKWLIRTLNFTADMLAGVFPAEYDLENRSSRALYDVNGYMDSSGKIHIKATWRGGIRNNSDTDDNRDEATTKWTVALVFITLPALPYDMATEAEERAFLQENMTIRAVPWSDFLPLLDLMFPGTHRGLRNLPGGPGSMDSGVAVLMYEDTERRAYMQYTVDGVTYHPGRRQWNPADDDIDIWNTRFWYGVYVNMEEALWFMSPLVYDGGMPIDTALFNSDGDQDWYSWTRHCGGLRINPNDGLKRIKMTWPDEIATDGMKPITTWAGNGLYCCVTFNTSTRRVAGVYMGTPLDTAERDAWWRKFPLVPDEWAANENNAILHIRPALVTLERVVLLAVVKCGAIYRVAYCDAPPSEAKLIFCGIVPLEKEAEIGERDSNFMALDICDFGEGEFSELLKTYPSPPKVTDARAYSTEYRYHDSRNAPHWEFSWPDGWEFEEEGV